MNPDLQLASDKAKIAIMQNDAVTFYTNVMLQLRHVFDEGVQTATVDGVNLRLNPDFFMSLAPHHRPFVFLHETEHVVFQHLTRIGDRDPKTWNIAGDYVINRNLQKAGISVPRGILLDSKYDGMSTDQVYDSLIEENDSCKEPDFKDLDFPSERGDQKEDDGQGDNGQSSSDPGMNPEQLQEHIDQILVQAAVQTELRDPGLVPGEIREYLDKLRSNQVPWNQVLRRFITKTIKSERKFTKPNRRYLPGIYLPSKQGKQLEKILICVDISGSVSKHEFEMFVAEVASLFNTLKPKALDILQFDCSIKSIDEVQNVRELYEVEFKGRGGTDITPVVEYVRNNRKDYHAVVCITDGYFDEVPPPGRIPWIWLINDRPGHVMGWGRTIEFDTTVT